ncbi:phage baseplate protein [Tolypothrix sp. FACHB-123]|uniref:T4 family baseplate hub assembly chaperone n=1 Tax=Tolypothrix sp. FACHB-123 TaxID=2692868 RepID=UPI001687A7BC|nr:phage baseplate protein [Tolypothrix sp. FACHB-123]MBD2357566.1 phage baseplate protein [Tolypothrix sp. FACHB-123]
MRPLTGEQILKIWEIGQNQHPIDRALTFLAFACPEKSPDELATLSIGQRDAHLLTLRELTFGSKMESYAECPKCGEKLEFTIGVADIRVAESLVTIQQEYNLTSGEYQLQFRLPNSKDLAAVVGYQDLNMLRNLIGQRCILQIKREGVEINYRDLPAVVITQLAESMAEYDAQAEILLNLICPACNHSWQVLFDIVAFFWSELNTQAKRLLREVHTLARYYGWREADILSMSNNRRNFYLDLVN